LASILFSDKLRFDFDVEQIERGEKNIGLRNLEKISKALGVDVKDLL